MSGVALSRSGRRGWNALVDAYPLCVEISDRVATEIAMETDVYLQWTGGGYRIHPTAWRKLSPATTTTGD